MSLVEKYEQEGFKSVEAVMLAPSQGMAQWWRPEDTQYFYEHPDPMRESVVMAQYSPANPGHLGLVKIMRFYDSDFGKLSDARLKGEQLVFRKTYYGPYLITEKLETQDSEEQEL